MYCVPSRPRLTCQMYIVQIFTKYSVYFKLIIRFFSSFTPRSWSGLFTVDFTTKGLHVLIISPFMLRIHPLPLHLLRFVAVNFWLNCINYDVPHYLTHFFCKFLLLSLPLDPYISWKTQQYFCSFTTRNEDEVQ